MLPSKPMTDRDSSSPEIHQTKDGSHTLYSPKFNQHYHNANGAVAESRHVFLEKNGFLKTLRNASSLTILEIGFGTGLNLLLLLDEYLNSGSRCKINYQSIEAFPVDAETARSFNFGAFLNHPELMKSIHSVFESARPGMNIFELLPDVSLTLFIGLFEDFNPNNLETDFIFHDPFSPEVNEELWTGDVFRKLAGWSKPDAILSTYCAASKARKAMTLAGWKVSGKQGAPGKREMTLASLSPEKK